jgi:hypothetical protein
MSLKIKILTSLLIFFSLCLVKINSQNSITSDSLLGEWVYHGPQNICVGDTITLIKEIIDNKGFTKWIFRDKNEYTLYGLRKAISEGKYDIGYKSVGDKWYYNSYSNTLKIDKGDYFNLYNIILYQGNEIILIKIK